ncbi:2Fe-2S ferredoxin [Acuticoccus sediminis]|uniref:2Fe-2S ferredoxin n=1 Tax=Acuticoccus sediminis TaxID=2184697 RepID=A0A8B2NR40_9HYPH|nr:Rieske (2Fe-2S) protein [Acuticoccus sediminis]RAI02355.1 2Fe-2S ferredoxin [Acuticoccus sediminis]
MAKSKDATGCGQPNRRTVIIGGGALSAAAIVSTSPARAATPKPERQSVQPGDLFRLRDGPHKGELLTPDMLPVGETCIEAFPFDPAADVERSRNRLNRVLVVRLDPSEMDAATREKAADGVVVYSAICTHQGCTIETWVAETRHLKCFCHLSEFAALQGGEVRSGPARRQLPMVPVALSNEGHVVATDGFTAKPGGAKT